MITSPAPVDEWPTIVRMLRGYALRKYGWAPHGLTLHGGPGKLSHYEHLPLCVGPGQEAQSKGRSGPARSWDSGDEPNHLSNFCAVYWPGLGRFNLTETQAKVVKVLWQAYMDGTWEVAQEELLRQAGSEAVRLVDLFKNGSPAWGKLVIRGQALGNYRLAPLPDPEAEVD